MRARRGCWSGVLLLTALRFGQYQYRTVYHDSQRKFLTASVSSRGRSRGCGRGPDNARVRGAAARGRRAVREAGAARAVLRQPTRRATCTRRRGRRQQPVAVVVRRHRRAGAHATLAWWRRTGAYPDVAFRYLWRVKYRKGHTLKAFIAPPRYRLEAARGRFEVWAREPAP